jgi:hypothetical protein
MTVHGSQPDASAPSETGFEPVHERPRPQWGWFVLFGLNVVIHRFYWQETDTRRGRAVRGGLLGTGERARRADRGPGGGGRFRSGVDREGTTSSLGAAAERGSADRRPGLREGPIFAKADFSAKRRYRRRINAGYVPQP